MIYIYIYVCVCVCISIYIYIYIYMCVCVCIYVYTRVDPSLYSDGVSWISMPVDQIVDVDMNSTFDRLKDLISSAGPRVGGAQLQGK